MLNDLDKHGRGLISKVQEIVDLLVNASACSLKRVEDMPVESLAVAVAPLVVGAALGSPASRIPVWGMCFRAGIASRVGIQNEGKIKELAEVFEENLKLRVEEIKVQTQNSNGMLQQ